jgi:two-component system nitrate/nitrite response regulator NarL
MTPPNFGMKLAHSETMEKYPIRVLLVENITSSEPERLIQREMPRMSLVGKASLLEEAVNAAHELRPDVILLDIDLKDKYGFDLLPGLLQSIQTRIIALTNSKELRVFEQVMLAGASGIVAKAELARTMIRAIECVHRGELWFDRATTARVLKLLLADARNTCEDMDKIMSLTRKERAVIIAVVRHVGRDNQEIASRISISHHTLRNHLTSIYHKLGLRNRLELYQYAIAMGLDDDPTSRYRANIQTTRRGSLKS